MVGVDQLVAGRRRLGQNAEPPCRIDPEIVLPDGAGRDRRTADAMAAVAAGDEVADELPGAALRRREGDPRRLGIEVEQPDRTCLEEDLSPPGPGEARSGPSPRAGRRG